MSSKPNKTLELDIHKMVIDEHGVQDFFWPVSYKERQGFFDDLTKHYVSFLNQPDPKNDLLSYKFFAKYFITETIAVFNSDLLRERFKEHSYTPICKKNWRLWPHILFEKQPQILPFIEKLKKNPATRRQKIHGFLKKIIKVFSLINPRNKSVNITNLKLKPITEMVLKKDIIATDISELIQKNAEKTDKDVVFCRSDRWFSPIKEHELELEQNNKSQELEKEILNFVTKLYEKHNISLKDPSRSHLNNILSTGSAYIRIHYKRLLESPNLLPRCVWTGSGGNTWDAMLRYASYKTYGSPQIGHDHGAGLGHVNNPTMALTELWGCSDFICLNHNQATEISRQTQTWEPVEKKFPILSGLKNTNKICTYQSFQKPRTEIKTIIVLATLYGGDRVWMGPCSPDIVHVDWQARLITQLKAWGYNVILKVHPETPVMPPPILEALGASIRSEPLEEMMTEGDLVLFDCLYTSVFRSVISTNIPMVLIDFYDHPWTDRAKDMIKNRIGFVEGWFDDKNRETVEWSNLQKAIKQSQSINNNTDFYDYYYA